jgi:hypothetical protein
MKYEKPEVVAVGSALAAVQAHGKPMSGNWDNIEYLTTTAYEADE